MRVLSYEETSQQAQMELLLDDGTLNLVREYCGIASQKSLSDPDADRLAEILSLAEDNGCLEFWLNEADHFLAHELGLKTGKTIYPFETANQKAALLEHLDFWERRYGELDKSDEAAELIEEIQEFIQSGSCELQESLREKGFDPGPIDGVVGPRTQKAIIRFQKAFNLYVSGRIDEETQLALGCGT